MTSLVNSTKHFQNNTNTIKPLQKLEEEVILPNTFYESNITLISKLDKDTTRGGKPVFFMNTHAKRRNKILTKPIQQYR